MVWYLQDISNYELQAKLIEINRMKWNNIVADTNFITVWTPLVMMNDAFVLFLREPITGFVTSLFCLNKNAFILRVTTTIDTC